jgi:hypothetical protein
MGLLMESEKVCDGAPGKGYVCFIDVQEGNEEYRMRRWPAGDRRRLILSSLLLAPYLQLAFQGLLWAIAGPIRMYFLILSW